VPDFFPRSKDIPSQSPLFWVTHKDRYLRQLLIRDIQEETKRNLVVYFTDCDRTTAQIDQSDDVAISELLAPITGQPVDLLLETNGGATDATEKICSLLRQSVPNLRVIVPRRAKSNGTVIALCGTEIIMGQQSELGPIDPSIGGVPAEFVVNAPPGSFSPIDFQFAESARKQTRKLASALLMTGMMKANTAAEIEDTIEKLATKNTYHSHGSSIDADEAKLLKLAVKKLQPCDQLWKQIWLLRTMYQHDCGQHGYSKLFEGSSISSAVPIQKSSP
jgi:Serine dehydrogenase proteinase